MKKTIAIIACAAAMLLAGTAKAQLGVNIGYAPVTYTSKVTVGNTTNTTSTDLNGFFAGFTYNYGFAKNFGVAFGLQGRFNFKKQTGSNDLIVVSANDKIKTTQILLDVPLLFNYSLPLGSKAKLSAFVGPTFSLAVYGNTHVTTTTTVLGNSSTSEKDYDMYGDDSENNRFDIAAAFGLQFQYDVFRLFGGYRFGLMDLNSNDNIKTKSAGFFVGLGYTF